MTYICPDCGLQVERGHRVKTHPPRMILQRQEVQAKTKVELDNGKISKLDTGNTDIFTQDAV